MSKIVVIIKDTVSNVNKSVTEQIEQCRVELNETITARFTDIKASISAQINDAKKSVTTQFININDEISTRASVIGSSIADQMDEMKSVQCKLTDSLSFMKGVIDNVPRSAKHVTTISDVAGPKLWIDDHGTTCSKVVQGNQRRGISTKSIDLRTRTKDLSLCRRKVVGTRRVSTSTSKLMPSTDKKLWHIYIGKLSKETSDEDIKSYLEENDIKVSEVRKLKATQEWQEKSSAFRVSIDLSCKDSVMEDKLWPSDVDVRDWYFKPRD